LNHEEELLLNLNSKDLQKEARSSIVLQDLLAKT